MIKALCLATIGTFIFCNAYSQHNCSKYKTSLKNVVAEDSRSDSLDIIHTHLYFDFSDFQSQELIAIATIDFQTLVSGIEEVDLDIIGLSVSEILMNEVSLSFTQEEQLLKVYLPNELELGAEFTLVISYSGNAETDASGWGGFYWDNQFAYNLGVGFDADPHPFGRAWFPCFDSFVERCTFSFVIKTESSKAGVANGTKLGVTEDDEGYLIHNWQLNMSIPSYLASIAIGPYEYLSSTYTTMEGIEIPQHLIAPAANLSDISDSFINLPIALSSFEDFYGPYQWERVGYVFVPFNSGAMEHATNIAYPISFANGSLNFETLMAHELAHHWWGDLITCATQEDMWINEGMASYSEALFMEQNYGEEAYYEWISDNHRDVLLSAHTDDAGYLPVSGIDHANTYGTHVYSKGASVGHNLRSYMGTENFKEATTEFMSEFALQSVSSIDLRDFYQSYTERDLESFFNDWVFNPGFTDFNITEVIETELSQDSYEIQLTIEQRVLEAPAYFTNLPIQITFISSSGAEEQRSMIISGDQTSGILTIPFSPAHILLNREYELTPAILAEEKVITSTGIESFSFSEFRSNVSELGMLDSIWIRSECHFTGPNENIFLEDYYISSDRFWRIHSNIAETSSADGRISFYGSEFAFYDYDLEFFSTMANLGFSVADLKLLHKPLYSENWIEHADYSVNNFGGENNFNGYIDFALTSPGDYTWGFINNGTLISEQILNSRMEVYPNPVHNVLNLGNLNPKSSYYKIYDLNGKLIVEETLRRNGQKVKCQELTPGHYIIEILDSSNKNLSQTKFIKD